MRRAGLVQPSNVERQGRTVPTGALQLLPIPVITAKQQTKLTYGAPAPVIDNLLIIKNFCPNIGWSIF